LFVFNAPFALVVLGARAGVHWLQVPARLGVKLVDERGTFHPTPWRSSLAAVPLWLLLWSAPMVAVRLLLGPEHVLWDIGLFFSQLAAVTFGGAYAVLAYMAQEAVSSFGWLAAGETAVGLGLAETTPWAAHQGHSVRRLPGGVPRP
jgi:chromate transporter